MMQTFPFFPIEGTVEEMAIYVVTSLFWTVPMWLAAPKLDVSRWWCLFVLYSPVFLVCLIWHFALPPAWRPIDSKLGGGEK